MTTSMSTARSTTRRALLGGALALAVLTGGVTAAPAAAAPAASPTSSPQSATSSRTSDFGFATRVTRGPKGDLLTLDRAIMHTGPRAAAQRAARGLPAEPEHYLQNDNPRLRTFRLAPGVKVYGSQQMTGSPSLRRVTVEELRRFVTTPAGTRTPFTMTKDRSGRIVTIAEYYLP